MPTPDEYADSLLSPDDFADQILGGEEQPSEPAPVEQLREFVDKQPLRGDQAPPSEAPWYADVPGWEKISAAAEGLGRGALANTTDEIQAGAMGAAAPSADAPERMQGYQGIEADPGPPTEYAAGSQFEDARETLETEQQERRAQEPVAGAIGELGGAGLQAAALPVTGLVSGAATGAGLTAANYMGAGSGDISNRANQATEEVKEHPWWTALGVGAPAVAGAVGSGLRSGANTLQDMAKINRTAVVMSPGQRAAYAANKGGKKGLIKLGENIQDAGLHRRQMNGPWYSNLLPGTAENMLDNSVALEASSGQALNTAENVLSAANPRLKVQPVIDDLAQSATAAQDNIVPGAGTAESNYRKGFAENLQKRTEVPAEGPGYKPPAPEYSPDYLPTPDELAAHAALEPIPPAPGQTGEIPFEQLVKQRRNVDAETNFLPAGGVENAGMKGQVNRQVGTALRQSIGTGLDEAALADPSLAQPVKDWKGANKQFSLAKTVKDPALMAMQKEYGGTMGLKDMATAGAAQALGLPSGAALAAGKLMRGGRGANMMAGSQNTMAGAMRGVGVAAGPTALVGSQKALPSDPQEIEKNETLTDQIQAAGSTGWDWIKQLLQ